MENIQKQHLEDLLHKQASFFIYISAPNCSVCKAVYPQIKTLMDESFPKLQEYHSNSAEDSSFAAQLGLYANPSLLIYMGGQLIYQKSRIINLNELKSIVQKYYIMYYGDDV